MRHDAFSNREDTMTLASFGDDAPHPTPERLIPSKVKIGLIALALTLVGLLGYGIGANHGTGAQVLTGRAYASPYQAAVTVGGWTYGFEISPNGMRWYDAGGGSHEGGIPPCLQHPGNPWIRFGIADATGLNDQSSWRAVTWVQCIDHAG
jgi:hypothetical protein